MSASSSPKPRGEDKSAKNLAAPGIERRRYIIRPRSKLCCLLHASPRVRTQDRRRCKTIFASSSSLNFRREGTHRRQNADTEEKRRTEHFLIFFSFFHSSYFSSTCPKRLLCHYNWRRPKLATGAPANASKKNKSPSAKAHSPARRGAIDPLLAFHAQHSCPFKRRSKQTMTQYLVISQTTSNPSPCPASTRRPYSPSLHLLLGAPFASAAAAQVNLKNYYHYYAETPSQTVL